MFLPPSLRLTHARPSVPLTRVPIPASAGCPDWQSGEKKDLKWRLICAGVEKLIEERGLKAKDVLLWVDWQSIYQDDKEEKLKGVRSLIKYATLCDYMLVPTEEEGLRGFPELIPGYGSRGWCRVEYFIFSLAAEMRGREAQVHAVIDDFVPGTGVPLYGIRRDGSLYQYPLVMVTEEKEMPSHGALSNPADKVLVQDLEDTMIEAYGKVIVGLVMYMSADSKACDR